MIADDHYSARDALELIEVEYDELPVVVDARAALDRDAPLIRDDKHGQGDNRDIRLGCREIVPRPTECSTEPTSSSSRT